jgi:hypothetical protein
MVNKKALRSVHNFPAQTHSRCFTIRFYNVPDGIDVLVLSFCVPLEMIKLVESRQVDNGEYAFAQVNPPICVAETEQAKGEKGTGENKVEPKGYRYC